MDNIEYPRRQTRIVQQLCQHLATRTGILLKHKWLSIPRSARRTIVHPGSFSDGLITKVFPQVIATGIIHNGIMAGKLKGQIPSQVPVGQLSRPASTK
jgi:hypothetical protein